MQLNRPIRQKRYALLAAALLLFANALVTAHAFGSAEHVIQDGCQLLHQVERQPVVSAGVPVPAVETGRYALPESRLPVPVETRTPRYFHSRAPPLA